MSHPETWAKKKQDPLGGTYVSPVTWAKKTRPARGTYVSSVTWAKKQDPLGGTYVSPVTWAKKKTRPARGDVCLTSDVGKKNKTR